MRLNLGYKNKQFLIKVIVFYKKGYVMGVFFSKKAQNNKLMS